MRVEDPDIAEEPVHHLLWAKADKSGEFHPLYRRLVRETRLRHRITLLSHVAEVV